MMGAPTPHKPPGKESSLDSTRLWYIDGNGYDVSGLVREHPGGCQAIRLGRGIDCTALFHSYHLLEKPELPQPCAVGTQENRGAKFTFQEGGFYHTVQQRACDYFRKQQHGTYGALRWQIASALALLATGGSLYLGFVVGSLWGAVAHGLLRALTAVGPGHAASHFALFRPGQWNSLAFRLASPLLISNLHFWSRSHVVGHHVHTMTPLDLQLHYPVKRVCQDHRKLVFHRFQHLYMWLVYALTVPLWMLHDVLLTAVGLFSGTFGGLKLTLAERAEVVLTVAANVSINMLLPFLYLGIERAAAVFLVSSIASSIVIALPNIVNHEVPDVGNVVSSEPVDWGVHQVVTSHNYATGSFWVLCCSGGLNLQIEHHLFPSVHYCHYPDLSKIVRSACAEYGLPYNTSRTLWEALRKHYAFLKLYAWANSGSDI